MTGCATQTSRPRLSVAMIVRNEQDVLAESLESVRPIADEIVVLDTGSTDQTPSIARRCGAVVEQFAWCEDFSAARNHCLSLVTGNWVLWLDAGERLPGNSAAELREFIDRLSDPSSAYMMLVEVPPAVPGTSGEQVAQMRLVPNRKDLKFTGRLRETIQPSVEAAGLHVNTAPGRILRHPRQHDPERRSRIARRDLELAELEIAGDSPPSARLLLAAGEAHGNLDDRKQARDAFLNAIEVAEHGSTEMLEAYYGLLTNFDTETSGCDDQLNICLEALEIYPLDAQLLLAMGNYLQSQNRLDLATRSFEVAIKHGQINLEVWHLSELAEMAANCFSAILQLQGKDKEAFTVLEESLDCNSDSSRLRRSLIDLHIKHGRSAKAIELINQLPEPAGDRRPLQEAVRGACMAAGQNWTPALGCLQSAYLSGCRDPLCLRWLSVVLLSNGQIEAAAPVLQDWYKVEPANAELHRYLEALRQHRRAAMAKADSEEPSLDDSSGHQYRVDQGAPVLPASPVQLPTISQDSSVDVP